MPDDERDERVQRLLDELEALRRALATEPPSPALLERAMSLLAPLITARAGELESDRGRQRALRATLTAARAGESIESDLAAHAWVYWCGDGGTRLRNVATKAHDAESFTNAVLVKLAYLRKDSLRAANRRIEAESEPLHEDHAAPPVREVLDAAPYLLGLERTGLAGGPLLCVRMMYTSNPPESVSEREAEFLRRRGIDAVEFLRRRWPSGYPPTTGVLADALGYDDRNAIDKYLERARHHASARCRNLEDIT